MHKLALYFTFYKSIFLLCLGIAFGCSVLMPAYFTRTFPVALILAGTTVACMFKNMYRKHEFYFYYNRAISKWQLYGFAGFMNSIIALIFIWISYGIA